MGRRLWCRSSSLRNWLSLMEPEQSYEVGAGKSTPIYVVWSLWFQHSCIRKTLVPVRSRHNQGYCVAGCPIPRMDGAVRSLVCGTGHGIDARAASSNEQRGGTGVLCSHHGYAVRSSLRIHPSHAAPTVYSLPLHVRKRRIRRMSRLASPE
jgi:hypothetical protein